MRLPIDVDDYRDSLQKRNCALRERLAHTKTAEMPLEFLDRIGEHVFEMNAPEDPHAFFARSLLSIGEEHVRYSESIQPPAPSRASKPA
jgi:hypothetical protein